MDLKKIGQKAFLLCGIFIFILGCQGTRVTVESDDPYPRSSPSYKKPGPPPWAPAHGYRAKYNYRYYPSSRVYHDRDRGLYFYYQDGQWGVSVSLPASIRLDVRDYVRLEMGTDRPYEWDHEVTKRYPPGQSKKKPKRR